MITKFIHRAQRALNSKNWALEVCRRNSWRILRTRWAPELFHSVRVSHGKCLSSEVTSSRLYLKSVSTVSVRTGSQGDQELEELRDEAFSSGQAGGIKERRSPPQENPGCFLTHWVGKRKREGPNQLLHPDRWVTNGHSANLGSR